MNKNKLLKSVIIILLTLLMLSQGIITCCAEEDSGEELAYNSIEELQGKKIGVLTGSVMDTIGEELIPDCKIMYFDTISDLPMALAEGKIDAYLNDKPVADYICYEYTDQKIMAMLTDNEYAFAFAKDTETGHRLREEFSEFITAAKESGHLEELKDKWFSRDESIKAVDKSAAEEGENGHIVYGITTEIGAPFDYVKDGEYVGYDVDLAYEFAKEYGYSIEVKDFKFTGLLASLQSETIDMASGCITVTEERKESVSFSEAYYTGGIVAVVNCVSAAVVEEEDTNFFTTIKESFEKTFIRENRWELFLKGIGTTSLITVTSIVIGLILGFILFYICRKGNRAANLLTKILFTLVQRMPMVVLLMIMYYIVFDSSGMDGVWVSVIAFSLTFAAASFGIFKAGVGAVGREQYEAAFALGFSENKSFIKIIIPQAAKHFLPLFRAEVVNHIKATAIVGYIAVSDLTKMGDIIRSRTYEAFFPLIATAAIYFLLEGILILAVSRIEFSVESRRRHPEKALKGIKTK